MEKNQQINCTVTSCAYNNQQEKKCVLRAIHVAPLNNVKTMKPDESMCASYEFEE